MTSRRERELDGKPLNEVADFMAGVTSGSANDQIAKAEFLFRQTKFQEAAAKAAQETAIYTQRYTLYMFWSVVFLALSAVGTLVISILGSLK